MSPWHAPNHWVERIRPIPQARLRLFCFAYAGGGPAIFRSWPDLLPAAIEVCAVQQPGKGAQINAPPYTQFTVLIDDLAAALAPYIDRPFALFGHSMGALLGYELARALRRQRQIEPAHLFVSGHAAPHLPSEEEALHRLNDAEFIEKIREFEGTPDEVFQNDELMQIFLPILRADFTLCETYQFVNGSPLNCPLTVFGGKQDRKVSDDRLEAWRMHTLGPFRVQMFPGSHFFINQTKVSLLQAIVNDLKPLLA